MGVKGGVRLTFPGITKDMSDAPEDWKQATQTACEREREGWPLYIEVHNEPNPQANPRPVYDAVRDYRCMLGVGGPC